ncbi:hypothetical protein HYS93_02955 [Candidatus Daviesbacteria bacterium]|nr:hypothetical protein [Candidatus Daviesbacteria bacterium]
MSKLEFTRDNILSASRGEVAHPLMRTIDRFLPRLASLADRYRMLVDPEQRDAFNSRNYGFLADAVEDVDKFALGPVEMVAIWSAAARVPKGFYRYGFARIVSASYAIQEGVSPGWYRFPRYFLENSALPERVAGDKPGLIVVRDRLEGLRGHLITLDEVIYGNAKAPVELGAELGARMAKGDEEAVREYDRAVILYNERSIPLVDQLQENFSNGLMPLLFAVEDTIEGRI